MAERIEELKRDIAELQSLHAQATRQKVKDILSIEERKLVSEVIRLEEQQKASFTAASQASSNGHVSTPTAKKHYQIKLNNYAWDQNSKGVKFYVTLPKVHMLPEENINCTFTNRSLELTVQNLEDKDYILTINNLLRPVNPNQCSWRVKTDMVIISLTKKDEQTWSHVTELEKKASDSKKIIPDTDKSADPSEGLMSIMRNMYEQGDDEMKRTIAKAWTESQEKKGVPF